MSKPTGCTKKGRLVAWLRQNPGHYRARRLATLHKVSPAVVVSALRELEANGRATRFGKGRNTRWIVKPKLMMHAPNE